MIRGAVRLAIVGAGIGYALDRVLGDQAKDGEPEPIHSMVVVDAGIEQTWDVLSDIANQPVWMTEIERPYRYAITHDGTFKGHGLITLEGGADGTTTIVRWDELLIPPVLPHLGALVMTPALGAIFQADLARFKELVETGSVTA